MASLRFSRQGLILHLPGEDEDFGSANGGYGLGTRIPIILQNRDLYVGKEGWFHKDLRTHHQLAYDMSNQKEGFFNGGEEWGNGNLGWWLGEPDEHEDVKHALLDAGYTIMDNPPEEAKPDFDEDFWHP